VFNFVYTSNREKLFLSHINKFARQNKIELEDVEPFSEEEFWEYLNREENGKKCTLLESVADILGYMGEVSQKERLKSSLAEYVITELVINKTIADDMAAKRAYMYYKGLIEKEINS